MKKEVKFYTTEEIYEKVTYKGHDVDYSDGSTNTFRLVALANGMGYKELLPNMWVKEEDYRKENDKLGKSVL